MQNYLGITRELLSREAWNNHKLALEADPALQQHIVSVLMEHCLPAVAAAVQAEAPAGLQLGSRSLCSLVHLASMLMGPSLASAAESWGGISGPAAVAGCLSAMLQATAGAQPTGPQGSAASVTVIEAATALLAVCCRQAAEPHMASVRRSRSAEVAPTASSEGEAVEAAWHLAASLPTLAASLVGLIDDPQAPAAYPGGAAAWLEKLHSICASLEWPLQLLAALPIGSSSSAQRSCWLAALSASLRLLPSLSRLDGQLRQHSVQLNGATLLCQCALRLIMAHVPQQLVQWRQDQQEQERVQQQQQLGSSTAAPPAHADGLPAMLWSLHTQLCRLVSALTAPAAPLRLPGMQLAAGGLRMLQWNLCAVMLLVVHMHRMQYTTHDSQEAARQVFGSYRAADAGVFSTGTLQTPGLSPSSLKLRSSNPSRIVAAASSCWNCKQSVSGMWRPCRWRKPRPLHCPTPPSPSLGGTHCSSRQLQMRQSCCLRLPMQHCWPRSKQPWNSCRR